MNTKITISKFQQVFSSVLLLTLISGGISLWLAGKENPSEQQKPIFETTTMTWNMGVGVIFGLLEGKATALNQNKDN